MSGAAPHLGEHHAVGGQRGECGGGDLRGAVHRDVRVAEVWRGRQQAGDRRVRHAGAAGEAEKLKLEMQWWAMAAGRVGRGYRRPA